MDEYDSGKKSPFDNELPLELEFEEPLDKPSPAAKAPKAQQAPIERSPFASNSTQPQAGMTRSSERSPFASNSQAPQISSPATPERSPFATTPHNPAQTPSQGTSKTTPEEQPKIIIYDEAKQKDDSFRLLMFTLVFGLLGALSFGAISAIYFSIGRRLGILFVAFFATLGARLGTDELRGNRVRWYAAFTAGGAAIVGKAFLVFLLFEMYPDFNAEDWTNFANPGKSAAIYFEQSIVNALDTGGLDKRTSQQRLDDRFAQEYQDSDSKSDSQWEYLDDDEEEIYEENEPEKRELAKLSFSQVFPKLFDVFDLPLIIAAMFLAFRFSRNES